MIALRKAVRHLENLERTFEVSDALDNWNKGYMLLLQSIDQAQLDVLFEFAKETIDFELVRPEFNADFRVGMVAPTGVLLNFIKEYAKD